MENLEFSAESSLVSGQELGAKHSPSFDALGYDDGTVIAEVGRREANPDATGRPDPSVGSKGDAYDNAMAEAWVATFKSELVDGRRFPSFEHAEHETLSWIGFYNDERLHEELGDIPPAEYEHHRTKYKKDNIRDLSTR